jgi:hypothetical protein
MQPEQKGEASREALGKSQGGWSTKVHLRAEGTGKPITFVLTPGQAHEAPSFEQLMKPGAIARKVAGCPQWRPGRIIGDKAYTSHHIRQFLKDIIFSQLFLDSALS